MASSWLPLKDAELLPFTQNMSSKVSAAPTTYGLLAADATALSALVTSFNSALSTATNPATRTKTAILNKDIAKVQLIADVRVIAKRVQANPAVTPGQKSDLGLPIHTVVPTPTPAPSTQPALLITNKATRSVTLRIADITTPDKKAKPANTIGAEVYSYVMPTGGTGGVPDDLEQWRFEGLATKNTFDVAYAAADLGRTATIAARWINRKGETGPVSDGITYTVAA